MEERFRNRSIKQSYDWRLIGIYLALVFIGLINIYASKPPRPCAMPAVRW